MTNVIDPDTEFAETNIDIGCKIVGFVASTKLGPYTDAMVDRVADWHIARKNTDTPE